MLCLSATIQKLPANTSILHSQFRSCKRTTTYKEGERDREKKMPIDNAKTCIDGKSYVNFKMLQRINECFNGKMMLLFFVLHSLFLSIHVHVRVYENDERRNSEIGWYFAINPSKCVLRTMLFKSTLIIMYNIAMLVHRQTQTGNPISSLFNVYNICSFESISRTNNGHCTLYTYSSRIYVNSLIKHEQRYFTFATVSV